MAQTIDVDTVVPTYRLLEKKIIFPNIDSFLYHWTNTFDFHFNVTKTKGGSDIYKLGIVAKPPIPSADPDTTVTIVDFPKNIQYISFVIEHHNIVRDEPSEYDANGRIHFEVPAVHEETSEIMRSGQEKMVEDEQRKFAVLINKLNAQLAFDFPSEHKRGEYFKDLCEYKINMSKFAKFKFEEYVKREGQVTIDIAFGWIIDEFKDDKGTQGITLNLSGYKFRPRDAAAEKAALESQKKRKETIEAKKKYFEDKEQRPWSDRASKRSKHLSKEDVDEETQRVMIQGIDHAQFVDYLKFLEKEKGKALAKKKLSPDLRVETEDPPEIIGGRYEMIHEKTI
jgi:hypothetical protein